MAGLSHHRFLQFGNRASQIEKTDGLRQVAGGQKIGVAAGHAHAICAVGEKIFSGAAIDDLSADFQSTEWRRLRIVE